MTIDPSAANFMMGIDPKPGPDPCEDGKHDYPDRWDYSHDPAGSKTCQRPNCRKTIHD